MEYQFLNLLVCYSITHSYTKLYNFLFSGNGFWPVQLVITNLPPNVRKYIVLTSVWYGPNKPDMDILLKPTLSKLNKLEVNGIKIKTADRSKIMKCKLLIGVFDLPARAMAVNMVQFNGYYGCLVCLDEGLHKNHRHLYFPTESHIVQ